MPPLVPGKTIGEPVAQKVIHRVYPTRLNATVPWTWHRGQHAGSRLTVRMYKAFRCAVALIRVTPCRAEAALTVLLLVTTTAAWGREPLALTGRIDIGGMGGALRDEAVVTIEQRDLLAGTARASATGDAGFRGGGGLRGLVRPIGTPWAVGADLGHLDARGAGIEARVMPMSVFAGVTGLEPRRPSPHLLAGITALTAWGATGSPTSGPTACSSPRATWSPT